MVLFVAPRCVFVRAEIFVPLAVLVVLSLPLNVPHLGYPACPMDRPVRGKAVWRSDARAMTVVADGSTVSITVI